MSTIKHDSVFQDFTRKYELLKTLRFRLEPTEKTKELLEKNGIVQKDTDVYEAYLKTKKLFDELHREFIREALENFKLKYLSDAYEEWKQWKLCADKEEKKKKSEKLRGRFGNGGRYGDFRLGIVSRFTETAKEWAEEIYSDIGFTKQNVTIFAEKRIIELLKRKFPEPEQVAAISKFDRFFGYLDGYNQARKNLYSTGDENTALAYRMVDVNLERYFANIYTLEHLNEYPDFQLSDSEKAMMDPKSYSGILLQEGIDCYNESVGTINKRINEYRQSHSGQGGAFLLTLHNQILGRCDKSVFLDAIETDDELVERLRTLYSEAETERLDNSEDTRICSLKNIVRNGLNDKDWQESVYFSKAALNTLLHKYLTDDGRNVVLGPGGLGNRRKKSEEASEEYTLPKAVSIADFRRTLESNEIEGILLWKEFVVADAIKGAIIGKEEEITSQKNYRIFVDMFLRQFKDAEEGFSDVMSGKKILGHREVAELALSFLQSGKLSEGEVREANVGIIKGYLDSLIRFHRMARYFTSKDIDHLDRNQDFYSVLEDCSNEYSLGATYDAVRNYLTKKPWNEEKMLLTFDEGHLLQGFMESPEGKSQYKGYILRKQNEWYLGVTDYSGFLDHTSQSRSIECDSECPDEVCYEKMEYFQLNWGKNIAGGRVYGNYSKKIFGNNHTYQEHKEKMTSKEHVEFLKDLIRDKYERRYPALSKFLSKEYSDVLEMQSAFEKLNIKGMHFRKIKAIYVDNQILEKGKRKYHLYLFKICNKDLCRDPKVASIENIHTLYWTNLFSGSNNRKMALDLGANAKVFFRKKTDRQEKKRIDKKGMQRELSPRFTEDTYLFHIPLLLNANISRGRLKNDELNGVLSENTGRVSILGLDRGEKHLIYYSLLGPDGMLKETGSFNEISENGKSEPTNYLAKLEKREEERKAAREEWKTIGTIKELKNGYVSQVVRKVADLALCNDAVIVLEDLNTGFKRGRQKIERQVYQKFELALAKKLNYLVDKVETDPEAPGHPVKGIQLTPLVSNYQDIEGKSQVGVMFYTRAGYTSTTCPVCGWRRKPGIWESYSNERQARDFLKKLSIVRSYDGYDITHVGVHEARSGRKGAYEVDYGSETLSTRRATRYAWRRINGRGVSERMDITDRLDNLFHDAGIDLVSGRDLSREILSRTEGGLRADFYKTLLSMIGHLTRMRYTELGHDGDERDMIHCPFCGFRSDEGFVGSDGKSHEWNGDANGAYNIARKGRMMLDRISDFERKKKGSKLAKGEKYPNLYISDAEWDMEVGKK